VVILAVQLSSNFAISEGGSSLIQDKSGFAASNVGPELPLQSNGTPFDTYYHECFV
jgi:hypothetical protein